MSTETGTGTDDAADAPARPLADLEQGLLAVAETLSRLEEALRMRSTEADLAGRVIDRLESDLRRLKQREDERRLEPAIQGVIALFDQVAVVSSDIRTREEDPTGAERGLARAILALEEQILELLVRLGATVVVPEAATPFDGRRQEVTSTVETADAEKQLTVASVRRPGFEFAGRVLRPAAVQVFRVSVAAHAKETVS
jgi:molecular chaperone GrpE